LKYSKGCFFFFFFLCLIFFFFSVLVGCLGFCLNGLLTCLRVGGPLEGLRVLRCGKWCPLAFFWTIWRERNNRNFEDLERSLEDIIYYFFHTLYHWTAAFVSPLTFSYDDFLVRFFLSN
jgi:hypothetical protein